MPSDDHGRVRRAAAMLSALCLCASAALAQGSYTTFGSGCPGSRGTPSLIGVGDHKVGGSTTIQVMNLAPKQPAVLYFGLSDSLWLGRLRLPFDLAAVGLPGCKQYVSTEGVLASNTDTGFVSHRFKHPLDKDFIDQTLYNQYAALDPGTKTLMKAVVSNAGKLVLGPACKDGPAKRASDKFKFTIPRIPKLNTPPITVSGSYSGTTQVKCCGGPLDPKSGCTFSGRGSATGSLGRFSVPVPADIAKKLSDEICNEVRKKTGGLVRCSLSFNTVTADSARLTGSLSASKNDCTGAFAYAGGGSLTFGKVHAKVKAEIRVTIIFTFKFTTTIDVQGQPVGSWKIANNKISASGRLPSIRASKTFKILGFPITIRKTFNTPQLSGTTPAVALPRPPIVCD